MSNITDHRGSAGYTRKEGDGFDNDIREQEQKEEEKLSSRVSRALNSARTVQPTSSVESRIATHSRAPRPQGRAKTRELSNDGPRTSTRTREGGSVLKHERAKGKKRSKVGLHDYDSPPPSTKKPRDSTYFQRHLADCSLLKK